MADHTEDRLLGGRVVLRQPRAGFRAAIDSVLLAASVPARAGQRVFEPGIGAGAAALCLMARVPGCAVTGLERQPVIARLAAENAALNGWDARVEIAVGDVAAPPAALCRGAFDHAMANPPYLRPDAADAPGDPARAAAHMDDAGIAAWVGCALSALKPKGTLSLIHRVERVAELMTSLDGAAGGITVFPLWPKAGAPARRVILRAEKGSRAPLRIAAGLVLHTETGGYTPAAEAILRGGGALDLA